MNDNIFNIPTDVNPRIPAVEFPFRQKTDIQMRFNDTDMLGHVNNNACLSYLDLGKTGYFNSLVDEEVDWKSVNIVVVNINVDFYAPTFLGEKMTVLTQTVAIGHKSLTLLQRLVDLDTGQVKCQARTVMAGIDLKTGQSQPIAQQWLEKIEAFEHRRLNKDT